MKIFVIGLPQSGKTTLSKALALAHGWDHIDAMSWVRSSFRAPLKGEHKDQHEDEYNAYLTKKMASHPNFVVEHVQKLMKDLGWAENVFVIDGISSPRDFASLFDFAQDIIVFLNRTDNEYHFRDHESIGTSVIRDYCFWMSSISLLDRRRWLEYNFKINGDVSDFVKEMGARNTVLITKSIDRVISHAVQRLKELVNAIP